MLQSGTSLQARILSSYGATGAGARVSLWSNMGPRPTPAPPEMPTQTQLSVVLLKTKFKTTSDHDPKTSLMPLIEEVLLHSLLSLLCPRNPI